MTAKKIENFPISWVTDSTEASQEEVIGRGIAKSLENLKTWIEVLRALDEREIINEMRLACDELFESKKASQAS